MKIEFSPIGYVHNSRKEITDDFWGGVFSEIALDEKFTEDALKGIEDFSHLEIIFYFNKVNEENIKTTAGHPRGNPLWPETGIFAQRGKNRPNRIGLTIVKLIRREGRTLFVTGLDAIDGTPVLDIKPIIMEFLPDGEIKQPKWAGELMQNYWKKDEEQN
jgi:tRNA-Thr(GGU) m(6)t(6)A37 methyltransferase TsaA